MTKHLATGKHCLLDASGCSFDILNEPENLERLIALAANVAGATVLHIRTEKFEPQGVTVVAVLSESHISIHTYPELGVFMADIFTCGDVCDPEKAGRYLISQLQPKQSSLRMIERGQYEKANI
jgi:S-adenosylmethionine decarboxylase